MSDELLAIEHLTQLGLNQYEAKAYLTLLEEYPVNGYVLSKNSGIPRSRIYEVLDSLVSKQIVFEEVEGKSRQYHPIEPKRLIQNLRSQYNHILKHIEAYAESKYTASYKKDALLIIKGRENILSFIHSLVNEAKTRIAISIWEEELKEIEESINQALNRNVVIKGVYFGKNNPYKEVVSHRRIERYISEKKERYITLIVDGAHLISGIVSRANESQVIWSQDKGLIEMSDDYIAHDLMINLYSQQLKGKEREGFEAYLDEVRKDYYGFSDEAYSNFK